MADFSTTLGAYMRSYPTLYREPCDALMGLMTAHGTWRAGQWIPEGGIPESNGMDYSDLAERTRDGAVERLSMRAERFIRRFMDEHLDVLSKEPTKVYFRSEHARDRPLMELIAGQGTRLEWPFLSFPSDIQPDWGMAIRDFHEWLQQEQRTVLGVRHNDTLEAPPNHWPEPARKLYTQIDQARRELFPLINAGANYDEHLKASEQLSKRLIGQLLESQEENLVEHKSKRRTP